MLKKIFRFLLATALQRLTSGARASAPPAFPVRLNTGELKSLVVRYAAFTALAVLNFLLFVGGMIVTAVAIAHSHDLHQRFVATNVFWTGAVMAATALALTVVCGLVVARTKVSLDDLIIRTPEPPSVGGRLFRPILDGMLDGLRAPRRTVPVSDGDGRYRTPAA